MKNLTIEALQFYEENPQEFGEDILHHTYDDWQKDAFKSLVNDHFIAIRAGSGVGKSFWVGDVTAWFLATKPFCRIPTTAPSQHQLKDILWAEHHKNMRESEFLGELLVWTSERLAVKKYAPDWYAVARTARVSPAGAVAEGLQGFHAAENLLYIVDEASGVPDAVFPAIEGALTGKKAYCILTGNPTRLHGYFYDVFNNYEMRGLYKLVHVNSEHSKFVEERYLRMMEARYGREHPIYQIKVLGNFPTADVSMVFSPEDIEKMRNNSRDMYDNRTNRVPIQMGLDIGRTTNKSVLCIRRGYKVLEFVEKPLAGGISDVPDVTNWAIEHMMAYNPESVKVDSVGIGAGVYDNLKRLYPRIVSPVIGQAAVPEEDKTTFTNLRALGYWNLRDIFPFLYIDKIPDRLLVEAGNLLYEIKNGKILIQAKESMERSPDYLDALMYAYLEDEFCADEFNVIVFPSFGKANSGFSQKKGWDLVVKGRSDTAKSSKFDLFHT